MHENSVEGNARDVGGKMEEGIGRLAGDARLNAEGVANQAAGTAQALYGRAGDTAREQATNLDAGFAVTLRPAVHLRSNRTRHRLALRPDAPAALTIMPQVGGHQMCRENDGLEEHRGWATELLREPRLTESHLMGLPPKDPNDVDDENDDDEEDDEDEEEDEQAVIREPDE